MGNAGAFRDHRVPSGLLVALFAGLCVGVMCSSGASAETITVPLPELLGLYTAEDRTELHTTVTLAVDPAEIVSVSMHASGAVLVGIEECVPWGGFEWEQFPLQPNLRLRADDPLHDSSLTASRVLPEGESAEMNTVYPFDVTAEFHPGWHATWEFLATSPVELGMSAQPNGTFSDCDWVIAPRTRVEVAELIVQTQPKVPSSITAWGAVKALFGN